jgi:hypothetical protein
MLSVATRAKRNAENSRAKTTRNMFFEEFWLWSQNRPKLVVETGMANG